MSELIFIDEKGVSQEDKLHIDVKPDQIEWGYGLNTQVIPTYGGEVVQILSAYIENMTVTGQVRTYKQAEKIFEWFVKRVEDATQTGEFRDQMGVKMQYPEREWEFFVLPLSIGPLKYGRDVVVPEWTATFHVVQPDQDFMARIVEEADLAQLSNRMGAENGGLFGKATGNIGWEEDDPFRSPITVSDKKKGGKTDEEMTKEEQAKQKRFDELYSGLVGGEVARYETSDLGDWFNNLIPSYLQSDFDDLTADYSRPAFGQQGNQQPGERNQGIVDAEEYVRQRTGN